MSIPEPLIVGMTFLLAGWTQGLTGFGLAMVTTSLLVGWIAPEVLVPANLAVTLVVCMLLFGHDAGRVAIDWKTLAMLCLGTLPGVAAGIVLLSVIPPTALKATILIVVLIGAAMMLWRPPTRKRGDRPALATLVGVVAGALTPTTGINGPPVVLFLASGNPAKETMRATTLAFLGWAMALGLIGLAIGGQLHREVLSLLLWALPSALIGFFAGTSTFSYVPAERFRKIVLFLLLATSGMGLIHLVKGAFA